MVAVEPMIAVSDVEKSSAWYQELLGCRSDHGGPYFDRLTTESGNVLLLLHHWGAEEHPSMRTPPPGDQGAGLVLYFRVDHLDAVYERARQMKVRLESERRDNEQAHQREFSCRDPDGYFITICT